MIDETGWDLGRYRPILRLIAIHMNFDARLRTRFDASDLVHEALLRAQKNIHQCRGGSEEERLGWLQTILERTFLDLYRKHTGKNRDVRHEQSIHDAATESSAWLGRVLLGAGTSPAERAEKLEQLTRLEKALAELPDDQRGAIVQKDLRGATVDEIAATMGKHPRAVAGLLQRGRRKLRELMEAGNS